MENKWYFTKPDQAVHALIEETITQQFILNSPAGYGKIWIHTDKQPSFFNGTLPPETTHTDAPTYCFFVNKNYHTPSHFILVLFPSLFLYMLQQALSYITT